MERGSRAGFGRWCGTVAKWTIPAFVVSKSTLGVVLLCERGGASAPKHLERASLARVVSITMAAKAAKKKAVKTAPKKTVKKAKKATKKK